MTKEEILNGKEKCFNNALPDEILFILRGQDFSAPYAILEWIKCNLENCPESKLREAFECVLTMKKNTVRREAD